MKKRIMCALLTLIMLVSLVPVSASAASLSISESAITVLKQLQTYSSKCEPYGTEYRIGYGTICTCKKGEHGGYHSDFNESVADKALRAKLKDLDAAVNSFASSAGLSLSQGQHDALVMFSYDCGTSWMNGTGVLRSAIVNGQTGNEFINTMCGFKSDDDDDRRRVEAAMYLNGRYSSKHPGNYVWVQFDANGGKMVEDAVYYYDSSESISISRVPTKAGHTFMGWYTAADGGAWTTTLSDSTKRDTLYAHWQSNSNPAYSNVSYKLNISKFTSRQPLAGPSDKAEKYGDKIKSGSNVQIVQDYIDGNGARWCRIKDSGWVKYGASSSSGTTVDIDVVVTVTNSYVRSRRNASIFSTQNGTYHQGDQLRIINTASKDGFLWGQVADEDYEGIGWVALMYTNWNEVKDNTDSSTSTIAIARAVINCEGYLNVRNEAGTDGTNIVGSLPDGTEVEIYELTVVDGHQWGRTVGGWILLTYAKVTMINTNVSASITGDVLSYTFTGVMKEDGKANTEASYNCDRIGSQIKAGTRVAFSMVKESEGEIWGYNGIGWIAMSEINLDVAKFVVTTDSVTVREEPNAGSTAVEKVVKGVELDITEIDVVDATIWGKTNKYGGWVNLASRYVSRTNAPTIEKVEGDKDTGLVATVINTDSVRVRETDGTYGVKVIGSLSRGITVAVWETNDDGDWFKVDSNQNGSYDYDGDGWVYGDYLNVYKGTTGSDSSSTGNDTSSNGTASSTVETGLGIVANTYTGVNVRTGAGTGNAIVGKILTGTTVEILEVKQAGAAKWGRVSQGWICMDYVTMISNYPIAGSTTSGSNDTSSAGANAGGSTSETEGNTTVVSTPALYTGKTLNSVEILKTADADALAIRSLEVGASVTIQELRAVKTTRTITEDTIVDGDSSTATTTTVTETTYWARVNDGWIVDPENNLALNALEETTYTVTGADTINVRKSPAGELDTTLAKGAQVAITRLAIVDAKVWGYIEDVGTDGGWVQLDNLSEGAINTQQNSQNNTQNDTSNNPTNNLVLGSTGNTANQGTNGFVNNAGGYRYTGTVIRTGSVNVRATPSQTGTLMTTLKGGDALVIYETTVAESMAWGRCDAGWVYLYYVDLVPCNNAVDAKVVYNENTIAYTDANCSGVAGTYSRMSVVDIYEVVGDMCRTDVGWVHKDNLG